MESAYGKLLESAGRVVGQAKQISGRVAAAVAASGPEWADRPRRQLDRMIPLMEQVMRQTRERVMEGNTRAEGKIVSVFEPHTEVIRKGKASKPTEFGMLVLIQEAENQMVTGYEVRPQARRFGPADSGDRAAYPAVRTGATAGGRRRRFLFGGQ